MITRYPMSELGGSFGLGVCVHVTVATNMGTGVAPVTPSIIDAPPAHRRAAQRRRPTTETSSRRSVTADEACNRGLCRRVERSLRDRRLARHPTLAEGRP